MTGTDRGATPPSGMSRSPMDEAALAEAKSKVGTAARATVASVRAFADRATQLLDAPAALRHLAQQQVAALNADQVEARLREQPIGSLRDVVGKGTRLRALEQAGYRTVADVLRAAPHHLHSVRGIGPHTAERITTAARRSAEKVVRDTKTRFDVDRRDPGQTQLLATLAAIRYADGALAALRTPLEQFVAGTPPLVADAERAGSRMSMAFSGRRKKRAALEALARLDAALADPRVVSLQQAVRQHETQIDPRSHPPEQLWRDYAADAASFNALLSTVGGAGEGDDKDAARGFVPSELHQKITATPLGTRLLTATLRGYQVFGAQYALHQEKSLLGDEMGLGKTVQALAALTHLAAQGQRRFLVVCPASVQINWLNEIVKHTRLDSHSLHGADRDAASRRWLQVGGIAVTTFGTLGALTDVRTAEVAMLVVDEAHYVKNPGAQRSKIVAAAAGNAQRILFLTGMPMENRVEEFRQLVGYLQPAVARRVDASDAVAGARAFRRAVAAVYLRRNQEDVLTELPDRIGRRSPVLTGWGRSVRSRYTACWPRAASTSGCGRFRNVRACCSTSSPARAMPRMLMRGPWILPSIAPLCSTTRRCRSSSASCWRNGTGWASSDPMLVRWLTRLGE